MIFKEIAKKKGFIVAEYLYELEETATIFAERMKEEGYEVEIQETSLDD